MDKKIKIMPCLDMRNGRVVKGVHFVNIRDAGDPVECAKAYCKAGADEIALLDITATIENRPTMLDVVKKVAEVTTVPLTVGGGIADLKIAGAVLQAGANKISTSSAAFRNPDIIRQMASEFGADKVTVAIDVDVNKKLPSGYEVYIDGGRTATGFDAVEWAKKVEEFGAGEILLTSMDCDGTKLGYDVELTKLISESVNIPVIASGGAGTLEHLYKAFSDGAADAVLAASIFHYREYTIQQAKTYLSEKGVSIRL
jgi:cyclase